MVQKGKGIRAIDESSPTIAKRIKAIDVKSTEEYRRSYRSFILATPSLGEFISGVMLFEETLSQSAGQARQAAIATVWYRPKRSNGMAIMALPAPVSARTTPANEQSKEGFPL